MANSSHLERMGIELKCPICLSLLNSAVSLTCNHVFCNLCIEQSMRSASSCPVCKIPYRRREVRPSPHMDNLVSIYKSMELASGVNIFVTQMTPSTKLSDVMVCGREKVDETCRDTPNSKNQRRYENKMSTGSSKNNPKNFSSNPVRPSFPTKKRIQVPQHTPPETPTLPAKLEGGKSEHTKNGAESSLAPEDRALLNEKGETMFSPFFWLRDEEDEEKSSQQTDGDYLMDTPPDAPCFSDIKDSDDADPYKVTAKSGSHIQEADNFDSEMFEWTQRACSPELCSSPIKMQVKESDGYNRIGENEYKGLSQHEATNGSSRVCSGDTRILQKGTDNLAATLPEVALTTLASSQTKKSNHACGTKRSKKRARKASESIQKKRVKKDTVEVITNSEKGADHSIQEKCDYKGESVNLKEKTHNRDKNVAINTTSTDTMAVKISSSSNEAKTFNEGNRTRIFGLLGSLDLKEGSDDSQNIKIIGKNNEETTAQQHTDRATKTQNLNNVKGNINQSNNMGFISQLPNKTFPVNGDMKLSNSGRKTRKNEVTNSMDPNCDKKLKLSKKVRFSTDDNSKIKLADGIQSTFEKVTSKGTQPFREVLSNSDVSVQMESSEVKKPPARSTAMRLRKCSAISSIQCAFCQSTEDHNLSGVMVHYLKGKPVAADHNKGSSVIHAHRNCAEWAPNVYFDDDTAINLEAELARSRRIKCSCCGLKGAALGCYEKSCRKSFHFPCAKLTLQCRWDNENFVMLCPLHASLKLPNETCGSQLKQKKNCVPKRQSHMKQSQVASKDGISTTSPWNPHGLFSKMVLCCSALTSVEKETITEFERLSGVTVVKTWDSRVTHVIASTDENGACRRTLKFLMGILEGKWLLSIEWVKACMKVKEPVDEQHYEIHVDIHGTRDGARLGRLRLLNKQPKLFNGYRFYFTGDFVPSYKGYLQDLVIAAGGTVLHRKPISLDHQALSSGCTKSRTFLVYSLEIPDKCAPRKRNLILSCRKSDAETLAGPSGAVAVSNSWILNSIAACKLQTIAEQKSR